MKKKLDKSEKKAQAEKAASLEQEWAYQGKYLSLVRETLTYPSSKKRPPHKETWEIVHHPGAVVIIPVTPIGKIFFIKQWRRAVAKILIELPAGGLEKGEDPIDCAQRELREETGCEAQKLIPLGTFVTTPGFCTETLHLFLAYGLFPNPLIAEDTPAIDLFPLTLQEALQLIAKQEIIDMKTLTGVFLYEKWLNRQK